MDLVVGFLFIYKTCKIVLYKYEDSDNQINDKI